MTPLDIILIAIIWIFVGGFINHKRNWYKDLTPSVDILGACFLAFVFAPLILLIVFLKEFIINEWKNKF